MSTEGTTTSTEQPQEDSSSSGYTYTATTSEQQQHQHQHQGTGEQEQQEEYTNPDSLSYGSEEYLQQQQAQEQLQQQQQEQGEQQQHQHQGPFISSGYPDEETYNIFVGDLKSEVNEHDLINAFHGCGEIRSVHIFRDPHTNEQKGFGFVHFRTREGQLKALTDEYSHVVIKGRPCRVSISEQKTTLFVGNLPVDMNQAEVEEALINLFGQGADIELKTGPPPTFESRGFCFAQFTTHQRAEAARKILLQATVKGRPLNVSWAESRFQKVKVDEEIMAKVKTLFVSNISITVNEQVLVALFTEYGTVVNCVIVKNAQTKQSRGFAFVELDTRENAERAIKALDGSELVGQKISVVLAKPPPPKNVRGRGKVPPGAGRGGLPVLNQPSMHRDHGGHQGPRPYFAHPRGPRGGGGYQGGRGGKQRGGPRHSNYPPNPYQQQPPPYGGQGYQQQGPRYAPYQSNRQPYQHQQPQAYQAQQYPPQMYQQMYPPDQAQYYQQYTPDQAQQYYQQYNYPYKY